MKMKSNMIQTNSRPSPSWPARRMMTWAILFLGVCLLPQVRAQSPLPFYEPFPNTDTIGEELGQDTPGTATTWNTGNSISSSCARVENYAALQYPGLTNIDATAQSYGLMSYWKDSSSVKNRAALLTIPTNTTLYASCLVNFQQITNAGTAAFFGLSPTATVGSSVSQNGAVVYVDPQGHLLISKNSTTPATNRTYSLTTSNTYLLVLRYKYNTGSPDQVDLWVNPTSLGNDTAIPAPTLTTTNNANVSSFGSVAYYQAALPTFFYLDEIRVATNWSGVTPTNPPAGNLYSVTGGGSGCSGDSFAIGLSGSDVGVTYLLYTNGAPFMVVIDDTTNVLSVNGTGSAVSFGGQSATALYTVLATNTTTGNASWMSGGVSVSVLSTPNIATQPVSALVATNGLAAFTVSSSGSGFNYQWYRNGSALTDGGHVSGSQTTNLVISPATTDDAATAVNGYYVIVSNLCGSTVASVTNALTLDAPANLVWWGDGISNLWDVAVSTNWNLAPDLGYATNVFNFGDNVTFDDSSPNTTVVLANPNLSPSSITVNGGGGQNYTFTGNGALVGNGSILMNSLGSLTIAVQNSETGGIVASNGTVYFTTAAALGSGPITLAGGGLGSPNIGLVSVGNPITITGSNSIIGINASGGQPLVLTGPLVGLGGDLTFQNNTTKTGTPTIQITSTNLTMNLPVTLNVGSGGGLLVSGNNTSGTQIWNNVITGSGGMQRNASGGTTVLNNTNTFSGGVKLSNGSLGLGIDSVSSFPPTIDAGPLGTGTFTIDTTTATLQLSALGGARVVGNSINFASTNPGSPWIITGSNNLTLFGGIDLSGTNRVIQTDNTGVTVLSGSITDDGLVNGLTKTGAGVLYLDGANYYTGYTTNSAGILAGSGSLSGPVVVQSGAAIGAGDAGTIPGTFTLNSDLTLNGNVFIRVNKSQVQSNDVVMVAGALANIGSGTVIVTNVGPALAIGDSFTIFSQSVANGNTLTVTGGGMNWTNRLAIDGSIQALSVASTIASYPTNLTFHVTGTTLTVGWPATHLGWILQSQTNALNGGLTVPTNTWHDIAGSGAVTQTNLGINPANPTVFFRLRHP